MAKLMPFFIFAYWDRENKTPRNTVTKLSTNKVGFICKRATAQLETYTCEKDAEKSCKTISVIAIDKKLDDRVDNTVRRRHVTGDIKCKYIQEKEKNTKDAWNRPNPKRLEN